MTGSIEATAAITSATSPPSDIAGIACRFTKLGSRTWTRSGRVPPSDTRCALSSPRGDSTEVYTCPAGTLKPSVTSLKWWIRDSIDWPMIFLTCSSELPMPSLPMDSCAGQATFLSSTMTGPGSSFSRHCSMILRLSCISCTRIRYRDQQSAPLSTGTSKSNSS